MRSQILDVLTRKLEARSALSLSDRSTLLGLPITIRRYEARKDIILEGRHNNQCCIVIDGLLCRYKVIKDGGRQILSLHMPGDIPDLQSIHIDVMDHTVGTISAATVGFIPHSAIKQALQQSYELSRAFWLEVLIETAILRGWTASIGKRSAPARIAHFLCEYITRMRSIGLSDGTTCVMPLTQTEMGDALGLSTVHINKKLRELRRAKLVEIRAGQLRVLNWKELSDRADFDPNYLHLPLLKK
ncbi:Crp/Fnr family transcriptional regulator [Boseaceae bacterium BT-24-1]|nr:Crp/Fnr family transcriptional regulator [Boseaceae bacterium BT-24-1]